MLSKTLKLKLDSKVTCCLIAFSCFQVLTSLCGSALKVNSKRESWSCDIFPFLVTFEFSKKSGAGVPAPPSRSTHMRLCRAVVRVQLQPYCNYHSCSPLCRWGSTSIFIHNTALRCNPVQQVKFFISTTPNVSALPTDLGLSICIYIDTFFHNPSSTQRHPRVSLSHPFNLVISPLLAGNLFFVISPSCPKVIRHTTHNQNLRLLHLVLIM